MSYVKTMRSWCRPYWFAGGASDTILKEYQHEYFLMFKSYIYKIFLFQTLYCFCLFLGYISHLGWRKVYKTQLWSKNLWCKVGFKLACWCLSEKNTLLNLCLFCRSSDHEQNNAHERLWWACRSPDLNKPIGNCLHMICQLKKAILGTY